jgi:DNA-binding GntR family transcriptional regulator
MALDIDADDVVDRLERLGWAFVWALAERARQQGATGLYELVDLARRRVLQEDSDGRE